MFDPTFPMFFLTTWVVLYFENNRLIISVPCWSELGKKHAQSWLAHHRSFSATRACNSQWLDTRQGPHLAFQQQVGWGTRLRRRQRRDNKHDHQTITGLDLPSSSPKKVKRHLFPPPWPPWKTWPTPWSPSRSPQPPSSPEHCPKALSLCSPPSLLASAPPRQQRCQSKINAFIFRINQVGCGEFSYVSRVPLHCRLSFYRHVPTLWCTCFVGTCWCQLGIIQLFQHFSTRIHKIVTSPLSPRCRYAQWQGWDRESADWSRSSSAHLSFELPCSSFELRC